MKRIRILDISISALMVLLVVFALAPAVARLQRSPGDAKCQSNLRQWAKAMDLYLADNHQRYPTNGTLETQTMVILTDEPPPMNGNKPVYFQYGVNWVEALYPYIRASAGKTGQDWKSFRQCPNARDVADASGGPTAWSHARMTYAFNYNLVGFGSSLLRNPASLMMLREMDRRANSILRPSNISTTSTSTPLNAFLTSVDTAIPTSPVSVVPPPNRHGTGSYIVFADGHVRYFTTDYYPATLSPSNNWDPDTGQWYNFVSGNPAYVKTIAITP